jgi:xylitol oxidase
MDKREFLKTTGAFVAGSMLSRVTPARQSSPGQQSSAARTNWSGNLTYGAANLHKPATFEEVCDVVKSCSKLRALGATHSFNSIADSNHDQISLEHLTEMTLDEKAHTVTIGGGVKYSQLAPWLDAKGYALHNLASLPGITVAGACATATHGSGMHNGNLATVVTALEIVTADGNLLSLSAQKSGEQFLGAVVALGSLGVVTRITLNVQPTYQVAQSVYQDLSFDQLGNHFEEIFSSGYSVSVFTDWEHHRATQLWIKRRLGPNDPNQWQSEFLGAKLSKVKLHPLAGHSAESCTEQEGIPGPWYDRLPHFRIGQTPSSGQELQTEYFVPFEHGFAAVQTVEKIHKHISPLLFVTELRTIAADRLWMSMAYQRPSLAIHFTWKPDWPGVSQVLPMIEEQLRPFEPRPHWGKLFTLPPARLEPCYTRLPQFRALLAHYDPQGKFRNKFVNSSLYAS